MTQTALLIGGAGTGKTTELMRIIGLLIEQGTHPMEIGFSSFTRAARKEAATRASDRFDVNPLDLQRQGWFRTIHSTCKYLLQVGKELLPDDNTKDAREWTQDALQSPVGGDRDDDGSPFATQQTDADVALKLWSTARARLVPLDVVHREAEDCDSHTPALVECSRLVSLYEQHKRLDGRCDFTDLLSRFAGYHHPVTGPPEKVATEGQPPNLPVWMFDEAQDTSPLADEVCKRLASTAKWVYLVGDPYQSIFGWGGSDPNCFQNWPTAKRRIMPKSYRCPEPIMRVGEDILRSCSDYWDRGIAPADHEGTVETAHPRGDTIGEVSPAESWLLLARTGHLADQFVRRLDGEGIPWLPTKSHTGSRWKAPVRNEAIKALLSIEAGGPIDGGQWRAVLDNIPSRLDGKTLLVRGTKRRFSDDDTDDHPWVLPDKLHELGATDNLLDVIRNRRWRRLVKNADEYDAAVQKWGSDAVDNTGVRVGTIHSVKGAEADNVVLLTTLSGPCCKAAETDAGHDEECRVFYVGATRARKRLIVMTDPRARFKAEVEV